MAGAITRHLAGIHGVPDRIVALTAVASIGGLLLANVNGWPLWGHGLMLVLVWGPIFAIETAWTHRHYGWFALFYVLALTQLGHFVEHLVQMVQLHLLHRRGAGASGVFGQLDIEWVHLGFNTWVLLAVVLLLTRFRRNRWLWITAVIATWHQIEHGYIISVYLRTGVEGAPGLLAEGGVIGGGIGLRRPDLHFLYNVAETVPLLLAFGWQVRHTYNAWLARAFPKVAGPVLVEATRRARTLRVAAHQDIVHEGDRGGEVYVVVLGEVEVLRRTETTERRMAVLGPGQYFGEAAALHGVPRTATVRASTSSELVVLDHDTFATLLRGSAETADDVDRLSRARSTAPEHEEPEVSRRRGG